MIRNLKCNKIKNIECSNFMKSSVGQIIINVMFLEFTFNCSSNWCDSMFTCNGQLLLIAQVNPRNFRLSKMRLPLTLTRNFNLVYNSNITKVYQPFAFNIIAVNCKVLHRAKLFFFVLEVEFESCY